MKKQIFSYINLLKEYMIQCEGKIIISPYHSDVKKIRSVVKNESALFNNVVFRCSDSVEIKEQNEKETLLFSIISEALHKPDDYYEKYKPELFRIKNNLQEVLSKVFQEYKKNRSFCKIIADSIGYKTYSIPESIDSFLGKEHSYIFFYIFLNHIFIDFLKANNCYDIDTFLEIESNKWYDFHRKKFEGIKNRKNYEYEICYYLNSPICTSENGTKLGIFKYYDKNISLQTSYVNDDELGTLTYDFSEKDYLKYVNTKISYNAKIPIEAEVSTFEDLYKEAEDIGKRLLTNLRLAYEFEIGVLTLKIKSRDQFTPDIRSGNNIEFSNKYTAYLPKRFIFFTDTPIDIQETDCLRLFKRLNKVQEIDDWLKIACKRFNLSIDNYFVYNHDRLLDIAIAFEAIFLNDNESTKELTYRLSVRAAKFLGKNKNEKENIFKIVNDLYKYRSKIAHGVDINSMKPKDRDRINEINIEAPILLKLSIVKSIFMKSNDWRNYWQTLTLN